MNVSVCGCVCPTGYLWNHTCDLYQIFCACCLPVSVVQLSSDTFTIGRIAYRRAGVFFPLTMYYRPGKGGIGVHSAGEVCYLWLPCLCIAGSGFTWKVLVFSCSSCIQGRSLTWRLTSCWACQHGNSCVFSAPASGTTLSSSSLLSLFSCACRWYLLLSTSVDRVFSLLDSQRY